MANEFTRAERKNLRRYYPNADLARVGAPAGGRRPARSRLLRLLWTLGFLALAVLAVRTFWLDVYHVSTASMEPTILGTEEEGEFVLVVYDESPPQRFEPVVFLRGAGSPTVKRVYGLPGEEIMLSNGDVLINGRRLPYEELRPPLIPIFDGALHDLEQGFSFGSPLTMLWEKRADYWQLDASDIEAGHQAGLIFLRQGLHDGYLNHDRSIVFGDEQVNDGAIEFEFRILSEGGRVRVALMEQADTFGVVLEPQSDTRATILLMRRHRADHEELLAEAEVDLGPGLWHRLRLSNIDNHLAVEFAQQGVVLNTGYALNNPIPEAMQGESGTARGFVGGDGARIGFRAIKVQRGLHVFQRGEFANREVLRLGPDEIFVLGDNSAESHDSRDFGPVKLDEVVGRATWIVWPHWRPLR